MGQESQKPQSLHPEPGSCPPTEPLSGCGQCHDATVHREPPRSTLPAGNSGCLEPLCWGSWSHAADTRRLGHSRDTVGASAAQRARVRLSFMVEDCVGGSHILDTSHRWKPHTKLTGATQQWAVPGLLGPALGSALKHRPHCSSRPGPATV